MVATCVNHREREAIGICIACRRLFCGECVTRLDGINHCVGCLERLGAQRRSLDPTQAKPVAEAVSTVLLMGLLALSVWVLLLVVLPL